MHWGGEIGKCNEVSLYQVKSPNKAHKLHFANLYLKKSPLTAIPLTLLSPPPARLFIFWWPLQFLFKLRKSLFKTGCLVPGQGSAALASLRAETLECSTTPRGMTSTFESSLFIVFRSFAFWFRLMASWCVIYPACSFGSISIIFLSSFFAGFSSPSTPLDFHGITSVRKCLTFVMLKLLT